MNSDGWMFSPEECLARTGAWLASVRGWLASGADSSSTSHVSLIRSLPLGFCSRTSLAFCLPALSAAANGAKKTGPSRCATRPRKSEAGKSKPPGDESSGTSKPSSGRTSPPCLSASPASAPLSPKGDGGTAACASDTNGARPGVCLTLNTSEWPKDAAVCSLSQVLETGPVPSRYFLSRKAATGILRRAARRGRALPSALRQALEALATDTATAGTPIIS